MDIKRTASPGPLLAQTTACKTVGELQEVLGGETDGTIGDAV